MLRDYILDKPNYKEFAKHDFVTHSKKEYSRGAIHVNSCENYFSMLKRGLNGVYHHVSSQHLKRYIGEFDFRHNNRKISDIERCDMALKGIANKRLLYKDSSCLTM